MIESVREAKLEEGMEGRGKICGRITSLRKTRRSCVRSAAGGLGVSEYVVILHYMHAG